ncbi:uncharacterized protein LOC119737930 isoform X2 [Patiria miniata]|uniref:NTF2 domain-containing protein n=1 Tax=Patiria miniata TaxID=46514 RepID=A0A914AXV6_PATMI|nr:uncharacterized protein LOC119737930 isoform X2 [Patiria miniata]
MDQGTVIHLQGDMGAAVEIIVQEHPVGGAFVEEGSTGGATDVERQVQDGNSDAIPVFLSQNAEAEGGQEDGHGDLDQIQIPISNTDHKSALVSDTLFDVAMSERFGYVYSLDRAEKVRRNFEVRTNTSYVAVSNVRPNFGQTELSRENHRIYWEEPQQDTPIKSTSRIKFDGVPFILLAKRVLDCQHGRAWNRRRDKEKPERKRRKKQCTPATRKLGCLANITMRELMCFPEFKIVENSEYKRKFASKQLRMALKKGGVRGEKRIYIDLPDVSSHNHPIDQNTQVTHQALDERVMKKLQELVAAGVLDIEEMRMHLQNYVQNEICFGQPSIPLSNRRFFPSKFTIRTQVHRCCTPQTHTHEETSEFKIRGQSHQSVNMAELPVNAELAKNIGTEFCEQYYNTFDTNRAGLAPLYTALPFKAVKHVATAVDCQPTVDNSILISVLGQVKTDDDPPKSFHQSFLLKSGGGNYYVLNDIFRLSLHNF